MKNFVQPGNAITVPAPTGGVSAGDGVLVGSLFGVAACDAAEAADVEIATVGVFDLAKDTATVIAQGAAVYWDATNKEVTGDEEGNALIGAAVAAAGSGSVVVRVRLNGVFGAASAATVAGHESRIVALEGA